MKAQYCPTCGETLVSITEDDTLLKDMYQCSVCRKKWLIEIVAEGKFLIKELWRHAGGGTMMVGDEPYPSDDCYVRGNEEVTVMSTVNQHFKMPYQVTSLKELLELEGVSPGSKEELKRIMEGKDLNEV